MSQFKSTAEKLYFNSLALSSRKTYNQKFNQFLNFLHTFNFKIYDVNEGILVAYVAFRAQKNIKFETVKLELYAIQSMLFDYNISIHIKEFQILEKVLLGLKKSANPNQNKKFEITPEILEKIFTFLPMSQHYSTQIYKAAFTIALFGMLRCGEFANSSNTLSIKTLRIHNAEFIKGENNTEILRIFIPVSKTDLFREGVYIHLPCLCDFNNSCPVHELQKMLKLREQLKIPMTPVSPLFLFQNKIILQRKHIENFFKSFNTTKIFGKHKLTGHSFRRGGATALAKNGTPDWIIQMLGRWKSESYKRYIGCNPSQICGYIKHMISGGCVHN